MKLAAGSWLSFQLLAFKRLQRRGETELYSDEEIAAGAMDALIYRAGYEQFAALNADKKDVAAAFHSVYLTRENAQPGGFFLGLAIRWGMIGDVVTFHVKHAPLTGRG
jgi:hypothetical protein